MVFEVNLPIHAGYGPFLYKVFLGVFSFHLLTRETSTSFRQTLVLWMSPDWLTAQMALAINPQMKRLLKETLWYHCGTIIIPLRLFGPLVLGEWYKQCKAIGTIGGTGVKHKQNTVKLLTLARPILKSFHLGPMLLTLLSDCAQYLNEC